jgi:hypothetical protein
VGFITRDKVNIVWDKEFKTQLKNFYHELFKIDEEELETFFNIVSKNINQPQLYILSSRWHKLSVARKRDIAKKHATDKYHRDFIVFMNYFATMIGRL